MKKKLLAVFITGVVATTAFAADTSSLTDAAKAHVQDKLTEHSEKAQAQATETAKKTVRHHAKSHAHKAVHSLLKS
jgi:hypothetical protein